MSLTPPWTYEEALDIVASEARAVPHVSQPSVCPFCFGPYDKPYSQCAGCLRLIRDGVSRDLLSCTVPLSMAANPSPWYGRFSTYKAAIPENMYLLAATVHHCFEHFKIPIAAQLGGTPDVVCVTPSKRGKTIEEQRLRQLVEIVSADLPPLEPLLRFRTGAVPARRFNPDMFDGDANEIRGRRVVLIEDVWVSGSTVMSAATRLQQLEAAAVLVMPIARMIEPNALVERANLEREYLSAIDANWDPDLLVWPRSD